MSELAIAIEQFEETPIEFDVKDQSFQSNSTNNSGIRRMRSQRQRKPEQPAVVARLTQRLEVPLVRRLTLQEKKPANMKKWVF